MAGSIDCKAHLALCHKDPRIALPQKVQWPQIVKLRRSNMGGQFPGELYDKNPAVTDKLVEWLVDKDFSDAVHDTNKGAKTGALSDNELDEL